MKITKRQLRRMISEAMPQGGAPDAVGAATGVPGGDIQNLVDEYKEWAVEYMGTPSGANSSSVLATFLVDRGLDQGATADDIIADMSSAMKFDQHDVDREVTRARREHDAGRTVSEGKMRITKRHLRGLIKEELENLSEEEMMADPLGGTAVLPQHQAAASKALEILDGITPQSSETKAALAQLRDALEAQGFQGRSFKGAV